MLLSNGKPLNSGRIAFIPKDVQSLPASGLIGPDGNFKLTTKTEGDGAVAGEFKIRIEPDTASTLGRQHRKPAFPIKYIDEDSSGLSITVQAQSNQLAPIRLK
ncbi:hypothetical protein P12x_001477 [Tundrisphaera lichenicola]|uniref:hypothetical protein n=1 Tax=Tundrisphaera lichenicola TaxID=2029860 RepID=UPI003EB82F24